MPDIHEGLDRHQQACLDIEPPCPPHELALGLKIGRALASYISNENVTGDLHSRIQHEI